MLFEQLGGMLFLALDGSVESGHAALVLVVDFDEGVFLFQKATNQFSSSVLGSEIKWCAFVLNVCVVCIEIPSFHHLVSPLVIIFTIDFEKPKLNDFFYFFK